MSSRRLLKLAAVVLLYGGTLAVNALHIQSIGSGVPLYGGGFTADALTQWMDALLLGTAGAVFTAAPRSLGPDRDDVVGRIALVALFSGLGSLLLTASADLLSLYVAIELQSFGLYLLAALHRTSRSATAAGLTYFLLGALSSGVLLLGIALLYGATGATRLDALAAVAATPALDDPTLLIGASLVLGGLLFKVAAAPLHQWAPDVYDGSPTFVTAWLTTVPKVGLLLLLLRWVTDLGLSADAAPSALHRALLASALLSLLVGTLTGLAQRRIKRLFAYSTVAHVGFLTAALALASPDATDAFALYLAQYTLTGLDLFLVLLAYGALDGGRDLRRLDALRGRFTRHPTLSLCLAVVLFSTAGIPPLLGFFAKQAVLSAALADGFVSVALVGVVASVISAVYYLRLVRLTLVEAPAERRPPVAASVGAPHALTIAVLTLVLLLFVLCPSLLLNSLRLLTLSLST